MTTSATIPHAYVATTPTSHLPHTTTCIAKPKLLDELSEERQAYVVDFLNSTVFAEEDEERQVESVDQLSHVLRDGIVLCKLLNILRPGTVRNIGQKDLSFVKMDNIVRFLHGARQLGLEESQLFEATDLFEGKNLTPVLYTILVLAQYKQDPSHFSRRASSVGKENDHIKEKNGHCQENKKKNMSRLSNAINELAVMDDDDLHPYQQPPQPSSSLSSSLSSSSSSNILFNHSHLFPSHEQSSSFSPDAGYSIDTNYRFPSPSPLPSLSSGSRPPKSPLRLSSNSLSNRNRQSHYIASTSLSQLIPENEPLDIDEQAARFYNFDRRRPSAPTISMRHREQSDSLVEECMVTMSRNTSIDSSAPGCEGSRRSSLLIQDARETLSLKSRDGTPTSQFQLGNCIGKGQFGSVYKALDLTTGEIVAVKRLQVGEDGMLDEEIMKEVALLRTLSHTNVISYLGFVRSKNHINIVLEYAENGSLMSTLKAFGAFPEKLVASFCVKILNGLEYLHENSVVHCDLKAANILTTKTGDVKLTDFGVSLNMKIKENTEDGAISGTPNWMAPEVIELKGATPKSDIWSLGCTIVELATGKPPYANLIAMSAMFRIVEDDCPPIPENLSDDLQDFLRNCFQKDPDQRPSAAHLKPHPWIIQHQQKSSAASSSSSIKRRMRQPSIVSEEEESMVSEEPPTIENERNLQYPRVYYNIMPDECVKDNGSDGGLSRRSTLDEQAGENEQIPPGAHRFTQTNFGRTIECKVCDGKLEDQVSFCEVCSLVCHDECRHQAFSCPPKVNNQQPSYDWVFSAKIYNHRRDQHVLPKGIPSMEPEFARIRCASESSSLDFLKRHPQAANIRKYTEALGLTPHEVKALCENPALLSHTIAMQEHQQRLGAEDIVRQGGSGRKTRSRKNSAVAAFTSSSDEQCIIS
ncbi:related to ser thr protein kinase [Lichtheimia corymbifera JMRC:FSU:9682]|uniref:Related to ser thr protein kinase n=1 Tax=Lichtheimia corymbifera JMRC:FSU:9682 TaxID=1263082 RepID=A0A068RLD7_9FUNG|nr:related to ser thr protein kinase [Lichtheimia corymbifera JMRC:FSU:9682]